MFKRPIALRTAALPLVAALLAAGCSFAPVYERPAAPVAATFPTTASSAATTAANSAATLAWQAFVVDPELQRLINLALTHNRDLRVAVLNIEQARAQFQIRGADQFPSVGAALTGSRQPTASGNVNTTYNAGLVISAYELDFFGRVASLKDAALGQFLATQAARDTVQISLIASVASSYLSLRASDELLSLTRQTLKTREDSLRLSQLRFDQGVSSELDLRLAQSLLEGARVALAQQQRQRATDENALSWLVGQGVTVNAPVAEVNASEAAGPVLAEVPAGLPSELLVNRPDIRQAEQLLLASNANIGAARAAFFPRITLTAGAGLVSGQLSSLFSSGTWAWSLAPQLLVPLFDAGRNQAGLASAKAGQQIAVAQYEKAIQTGFREVADALAARSTWGEQWRAQQAQAQAEAARLRLADLRYQNGIASYLDLLDAQRSLFAAQQAAVQSRLALWQSQVALYKALGGGWQP